MKSDFVFLGLVFLGLWVLAISFIGAGSTVFLVLAAFFAPSLFVLWRRRQRRSSELSERLEIIESELKTLQALSLRVARVERKLAAAPPPATAAEGKPALAGAAPHRVPAPAVTAVPAKPAAPGTAPRPTPPAPTSAPGPPRGEVGVDKVVAAPQRSATHAELRAALKSPLDFEEALGTNWLSKLGIAILVLGMAFFLAWQMVELGPAGKVVVGWTTGLALLGAGVYFERSEVYRILARAGVAGGWAVLFFTAYAMYHVPAARVLTSPLQSLSVMLGVAAPMVAHTLRYRSQVLTGLAFLLAFATVALNRADVFSLLAGVVLAAGLSVSTLRMRWFHLEVFGILATYLNHFYWLWPIIEPMEVRAEFPGLRTSVVVLLLYWLIFRTSYILRKPGVDESVSTLAGMLNPFLLIAVLKYQSVYPEMAFWFLLGLGAVELALGQLPITRRRRAAFLVLSSLGAALLFVAFPYRFTAQNTTLIWLAEAEVFFVVGIVTREVLFRWLGLVAALPIFITLIGQHAARIYGARMDGADVVFHLGLATVFGLTALLWYANAHLAPRRWPDIFAAPGQHFALRRLSYLAGIALLAGAWVAFPKEWTVLAWMALAVTASVAARRLELPDVTIQASALAAFAFLRVLVVNLPSSEMLGPGALLLSVRLLTVALVAASLYIVARRSSVSGWEFTRYLPAAYTWAGSTMVTLLLWYELRSASVALGWAVFALALFELGVRRQWLHLRLQAYVALTCAFLRIFFVNFNATDVPGPLDPRVYTVAPLALAFYYVYGRLRELARVS